MYKKKRVAALKHRRKEKKLKERDKSQQAPGSPTARHP
jgi:hypothetical protein